MHGVPGDLPLERLVGHSLDQIGLGRFQLQFRFSAPGGAASGTIGVEGHWELHDAAGVLLDIAQEPSERKAYRVHLLLGSVVSGFRLDPPRSFTLSFDTGHRLTIHDDSSHYETFSVSIAAEPGIYV